MRELMWMANERKLFVGEVAAWHSNEIIRRVFGDTISIDELNPYRKPNPVVENLKKESSTKRFFQFAEQAIFGKQVHER